MIFIILLSLPYAKDWLRRDAGYYWFAVGELDIYPYYIIFVPD